MDTEELLILTTNRLNEARMDEKTSEAKLRSLESVQDKLLYKMSEEDLKDFGPFRVLDGTSLSSIVFVVCGKHPSEALEDELYSQFYPKEFYIYCCAISSIRMGTLKGKETRRGYFVSIDEFLKWANDNNVGNSEVIKQLQDERVKSRPLLYANTSDFFKKSESGHQVGDVLHFETPECKDIVEVSLEELTPDAESMYDTILTLRRSAVEQVLHKKFPDDNERAKHLGLIAQFSPYPKSNFQKYDKKGEPRCLRAKHRCQVIAKVIRHFKTIISTKELEQEIRLLGPIRDRKGKEITSGTVEDWIRELAKEQKNIQI